MEYDGLLSCQGLRAESLQQPLRWICYEADKKGHCRYCTLLYSEGHVGWFFVTTEVIDLRSFSEGSRSSGRCDSAPSLPLPTKETKRFKVDQRIYTYIVVLKPRARWTTMGLPSRAAFMSNSHSGCDYRAQRICFVTVRTRSRTRSAEDQVGRSAKASSAPRTHCIAR